MGDNADSKSKLEAAREQAVAEQALKEAQKATPVRSAKDAINAMYAQDADKRLSSYLAKSAKEIINSSPSNSDQKSAANLHQHASKRRIEMERPSASGVLRVAPAEQPAIPEDLSQAMDPLAQKTTPVMRPHIPKAPAQITPPVIKTSLKLGPKKVPVVSAPHTVKSAARGKSLNGQKGKTALSQLLTSRQPLQSAPAQPTTAQPHLDTDTAETLRVMQQAVKQTTGQNTAITPKIMPRPKMRAPRGLMQDVIRPAVPKQPAPKSHPAKTPDGLPLDSVKRRFRAAPKGFTTTPEVQPTSYTATEAPIAPKKPPVEIYGLMDEESVAKPKEMPVIEDYQPNTPEAKSPDNNKYTLKGQSPFFLKSVNVEKRPLSGSIGSKSTPSEGTLYERPANTPVSGKNVYDRKEERKKLPTKPTVIIPASRRSRAPLIMLLILTVILGAAMGAFIYLCFFKYME